MIVEDQDPATTGSESLSHATSSVTGRHGPTDWKLFLVQVRAMPVALLCISARSKHSNKKAYITASPVIR